MGCSNTKEAPQGTLLEQYSAAQLPHPWSGDYENEFEKSIFMGINLCRHDPKRFVPHVRKIYKDHVLLKGGLGKRMNDVIAKLQAQQTILPVRFDQQANDACRQNNTDVLAKNEVAPTLGGNIAKYSEITGSEKESTCSEFTMVKFEGSTGEEFVALQLALDFEDFQGANKDKVVSEPVVEEPVVAEDIQVPAAAEEPPAVAADKENGEEAKEAKAAKKPVAVAAPIVGYSPILDETVEMVGICNKAHQKTINVIQVLYCKTSGNAMI